MVKIILRQSDEVVAEKDKFRKNIFYNYLYKLAKN